MIVDSLDWYGMTSHMNDRHVRAGCPGFDNAVMIVLFDPVGSSLSDLFLDWS